MSTVKIKKQYGRPPLGANKKVKVSINLTPELLRKIEEDIEKGNGTSVSTLVFQIVKKYYS